MLKIEEEKIDEACKSYIRTSLGSVEGLVCRLLDERAVYRKRIEKLEEEISELRGG